MKTTLPTPSSVPSKISKPDPFQRLSLAVKKLDQLIDRAHQLGSFADQLVRQEQTGPRLPPSVPTPIQPTPLNPSTELMPSPTVGKTNKGL